MSESIDPRLNEVANALAALAPRPAALDRDRLLFRAGRASAPRPWFWRVSTAVSTIAAAALAAVVLLRPGPAPVEVERVVYVQVKPPPVQAPRKDDVKTPAAPIESAPSEPLYSWPTTATTRLEDRLLRWGLDGLAEPMPPPGAPPETLKSLLKSL